MKKIIALSNIFILAITVTGLVTFSNCGGGGNDPSPAEQTEIDRVRALITNSAWKVQSLAVDGTDQSALVKNLAITFTTAGFTTVNGGAIWPASGTWSFIDETAKSFKRDDGIVVTVEDITATSLKLSLTWSKTTFAGGRVGSVSGKNVFTFGK